MLHGTCIFALEKGSLLRARENFLPARIPFALVLSLSYFVRGCTRYSTRPRVTFRSLSPLADSFFGSFEQRSVRGTKSSGGTKVILLAQSKLSDFRESWATKLAFGGSHDTINPFISVSRPLSLAPTACTPQRGRSRGSKGEGRGGVSRSKRGLRRPLGSTVA